MKYLTAKESRVEKAWAKRGLAGLRSTLLGMMEEALAEDWDDDTVVSHVSRFVYSTLPKREWKKANEYIKETVGLMRIDWNEHYEAMVWRARTMEEDLREEVGDE